MSLRKKAEHYLRYVRCYLQPSRYKSAANTRNTAIPISVDAKLCVLDFSSIKIDNDAARYLYHLVTDFEASGYAIAYTDRFRFLATMASKDCKRLLLTHNFSIVSPINLPTETRVLVTDAPDLHSEFSGKTITINYDFIRPDKHDSTGISMPYFVHPDIHESDQVERFLNNKTLSQSRPMKLLFAGNAKAPKYDAAVLADKYKVLSRVKALEIAEMSLAAGYVRRPLLLDKLVPSTDQRNSFTIATTQDLRIPSEQWIETLALGDFYFACPGVDMPLCHNLIESLAAGSIPILQYPQYLSPPLTDGVDCLAYNNDSSLVAAIRMALNMPEDQIQIMRLAAQTYYKKHLQPGSFAKKLLTSDSQHSTVYLNACRVPVEAHSN